MYAINPLPGTSGVIRPIDIAVTKKPNYPATWFAENPGQKPPIAILASRDLKTIDPIVHDKWASGTLDINVVMVFLRESFVQKPTILEADWTSFNLEIGKKNQLITINDLFDFQVIDGTIRGVEGEKMSEQDRLRFLIAIAGIYRLNLITREEYREEVQKKFAEAMALIPGDCASLTTEVIAYRSWLHHAPFLKMMAAIDMYLNEFSRHEYAMVRLGTIVSRFKDCSMLVACNYLSDIIGMDFVDLCEWIWTTTCARQYDRVLEEGQEMDQSRSYSMYFMELGLSTKSPYSAILNKDLHLFVHTVGVSLGMTRSKNARLVGAPDLTSPLTNAIIMSGVLVSLAGFEKQYSSVPPKPEDTVAQGEDEGGDVVTAGEPPQSRNGTEWLEYIEINGGKAPDRMVRIPHSSYGNSYTANFKTLSWPDERRRKPLQR